VAEVLRQCFGDESVFLDIESILPGQPFATVIGERLKQTDLVLALIGERWLETDIASAPRICDPDDWVNVELRTAIDLRVRVLPVLVGEAHLPNPGDLPSYLQALCTFNAARLDDGLDFHVHMQRLITAVELLLNSHVGRQIDPIDDAKGAAGNSGVTEERPACLLLDRQYSYALTSYCADPRGGSSEGRGARDAPLFGILGRAVLLFDKIFIEQQYVSSIAWTLNHDETEAFRQIFNSFSFEALPLSARDRFLLAETIEADLADPEYRREIDLYYEGRVLRGGNHRELVTYVNNSIFAAYLQRWSILPSKPRARLFSYKLSHLNRFWNAQPALDVARHAFDLVVPDITARSLTELNAIRQDPKIVDFRRKIWEIAHRIDAYTSESVDKLVLAEFRAASRALADHVRVGSSRTVQVLSSGAIPLPIHSSLNLPPDLENSLVGNPFSWLLFLYGTEGDG